MRWAAHVVQMGMIGKAYKVLLRKPEGRDHSENLGVDGNIILEWILGKLVDGFIWLRIGTSDGLL